MKELLVLTVPGCPNGPVLEQRLAEAFPGAQVRRRVIEDAAEAVRSGMHGSPTLLVDGVDPFATPGTVPSLSCRIYRDENGRTDGAPSTTALRLILLPDLLGRAGSGRVAPVEGGLRALHQRVLASFAATGQAPTAAEMAADGRVLAELHAADFLRLDETGQIRAAYPFSAVPTPHVVRIDGGPQVYAMCAIDALGIAAMLGRQITITSTDPATDEPITVTTGGEAAAWTPDSAVVFAGQRTDCGACEASAADTCCGYVNFFTTRQTAIAWAAAHPEVTGQILDQPHAVQLGTHIFGRLLATGHAPQSRPPQQQPS